MAVEPVWLTIIGLAFAILVQLLAVSFFFGRLFERLNNHHARLKALEVAEAGGDGKTGALTLAVARVEVVLEHMSKDMEELKRRVG